MAAGELNPIQCAPLQVFSLVIGEMSDPVAARALDWRTSGRPPVSVAVPRD